METMRKDLNKVVIDVYEPAVRQRQSRNPGMYLMEQKPCRGIVISSQLCAQSEFSSEHNATQC